MTTVVVAYASLHGATAGLAGWLADELRAAGLDGQNAAVVLDV